MNKTILVFAQINRYNFLVVFEPHRALEGLQGVRFQSQKSLYKNGLKLLRNQLWLRIT